MIGYSDSGKDAGRLAAAWGLYVVQARHAPAYSLPCIHVPFPRVILTSSGSPT